MNKVSDFKQGMRLLTGAVSVITTEHEGRKYGLTATSVCSLSVDPPMLVVCVNRDASAYKPTLASGRFCVNVINHDDIDIAKCFSSREEHHVKQRFALGRWTKESTGAPLLESSLVSFDCLLKDHFSMATHSIFVGLVEASTVRPEGSALVYLDGAFRPLPIRAPAMAFA